MSSKQINKKFSIIPDPINLDSDYSEEEDNDFDISFIPKQVNLKPQPVAPKTVTKGKNSKLSFKPPRITQSSAPVTTKKISQQLTPKINVNDISDDDDDESFKKNFVDLSKKITKKPNNSTSRPQSRRSQIKAEYKQNNLSNNSKKMDEIISIQTKGNHLKNDNQPKNMIYLKKNQTNGLTSKYSNMNDEMSSDAIDDDLSENEESTFSRLNTSNYEKSNFYYGSEMNTSLNCSSYIENGRNVCETTLDSLQFSSSNNLRNQLRTKYEKQLVKIGNLKQELRQMRLQQGQKIQKKRKRLESWIENGNKRNISLRAECLALEKQALEAEQKQQQNSEYQELQNIKDDILQTEESFALIKDILASLNAIMVNDPLSKLEFEMILEKPGFNSNLGLKLKTLIESLKNVFSQDE